MILPRKKIWGRPAIGSSVPVREQLLQWDADYKPVKKNVGEKKSSVINSKMGGQIDFRLWCGCRTVRVGVLVREKGLMKNYSLNSNVTFWFWEFLVEIWTGQIIGSATIFRYLCTSLCCRLIPTVRYCEGGNNPTAWLTCLKRGEVGDY